jgi:hypothetical protein
MSEITGARAYSELSLWTLELSRAVFVLFFFPTNKIKRKFRDSGEWSKGRRGTSIVVVEGALEIYQCPEPNSIHVYGHSTNTKRNCEVWLVHHALE